jgi:hypothetical protein
MRTDRHDEANSCSSQFFERKLHPKTCHRRHRGRKSLTLLIFNIVVNGVVGQRHGPAACSPEEAPVSAVEGFVGPKSGFGWYGREQTSCPHRGSNSRPSSP